MIELIMMICLMTYLKTKTKHFLFKWCIRYLLVTYISFLLALPLKSITYIRKIWDFQFPISNLLIPIYLFQFPISVNQN